MGSDSYVDVVERLFQEFDWAIPLPVIAATVHRCRQQLDQPTELRDLEVEARRCLAELTESPTRHPAIPAPRAAGKAQRGSPVIA
jgi:hypothetical protein